MQQNAFRIALTATVVVILALVPTALAAKGKPGGGGTGGSTTTSTALKIVQLDGMTEPHFGGKITFELNTSAEKPYVNVRCYQNTTLVYDAWAGFYPGAWFGQTFELSSVSWAGGAASCIARLVTYGSNGRERTNATMNFTAAA